MKTRLTALILILALLLSCCTAFAESNALDSDSFLGKSTSFTYTISVNINTNFVNQYDEVAPLQYAMAKDWDPSGNGNTRKVDIKVIMPPSGSESDYLNTIISTGDYSDIMVLENANTNASEMYENGQSLDITDYVLQYMPNYLAYFDRHPELKGRETCLVNGEPRYLCLYPLSEVRNEPWGGMVYRRDWVVKYGKNPSTGEAFSGSWDKNENWVDDVVFPSGHADPITISDWEWMLDIFQTALQEEGIEDGYAFSIGASGGNGVGDFESGFGAANGWYIDPTTKSAVFGTTTKGYRTFVECMHSWYEKGWVNPYFYENANDMFFMIDAGSVYSGKVGAWYGMNNQLGKSIDMMGTGIVVFAAPSPINDVYGDADVQGIEPFYYYANGLIGSQVVITDKAKDKDLPALFTFLDYFFSPEGSILATYGLNADQLKELETLCPAAFKLYQDLGLSDGAYTEENGKYKRNPLYLVNDDVAGLAALLRFIRLEDLSNLQNDYPDYYQHALDLWSMYPVDSLIGNELIAQLTSEEADVKAALDSEYYTFLAQNVPEFITGERNILDDADWEAFCNELNALEPNNYTEALNRILSIE